MILLPEDYTPQPHTKASIFHLTGVNPLGTLVPGSVGVFAVTAVARFVGVVAVILVLPISIQVLKMDTGNVSVDTYIRGLRSASVECTPRERKFWSLPAIDILNKEKNS
jgi:hypothetical protein